MTRQVHIITAVANPLPQRSIDQILSSLDQWGVGVASGRWLGKKEAWEVPVDLGSLSAQAAADSLRKVLHNVDFAVTLDSPYRRKRLLCADMDSTMVQGETLDEVANMLGIGEKVAAITTRAMRGEIDFAEALMDRVAMLKGIGIDAFQAVLDNIKMSEGAKTLVATMKHLGAHCVLVTGGFDVVAQPVADMLGFNQTVANQLVQRNGLLTGGLGLPLVDNVRKAETLKTEASSRNLYMSQTMAMGDGANDRDMIACSGLGIAYHGKPLLTTATPNHIRHTDLTAALYFQGIAKDEWQMA